MFTLRCAIALSFALLLTGTARGQEPTEKYSDYVLNQAVFDYMPASLKAVKEDFATRLSVVTPIVETEDGYYFGKGCAAHECGENEAAWVINKTTGKSAAIIMRYVPARPEIAAHENFELYRTAGLDSIPTPLTDWAVQHGMTEGNVREVPEPLTLNLPRHP
jgi:hypothetical protein